MAPGSTAGEGIEGSFIVDGGAGRRDDRSRRGSIDEEINLPTGDGLKACESNAVV
jgi:hypothetical protein